MSGQRLIRRQDARAGQRAFCDRVPQGNVVGRAHALHRRKAGHQRDPRIRGSSIRRILRGLSRARIFSILAEAPGDVYMRVNPTGHQSQPTQIVVDRRGFWINRDNLRSFDHNARVMQYTALAIEHGTRGDHDAFILLSCLCSKVLRLNANGKNDQGGANSVR